ncbi:MAG: aldo/keto reductase [Clostridium sp.]|nr:aldo/keto reductase [Clostridium sp.]
MKKRFLREIEVSEIGMGCMAFSHGYGQIPERDYSIEAIRAAYEYGCSFFDTAETYGNVLYYEGHNEQLLGEAVKEFRGDVVLATKLHIHEDEEVVGNELYEVIRRHLDASMKRLGTDYVDLYYLHRLNEAVPVEEVAGVMGKLISEGLIRGWGLSQISGETLAKADEVTPVSAVQNLYNMLERDCETDIFPYCVERGIGVVPFSPIASGFLSGKITASTEFEKVDDVRNWVPQLSSKENIIGNQPIIDILNRYAEAKSATNAQIALAWMLHKYPNVAPIPGSKNKERILENLRACEVSLTKEEFSALEKALGECKVYGHRGHVETQKKTFGNHWKK